MYKLKEHIIFKFSTLILVLTLFMPVLIKLAHTLEHKHKHEICKNTTKTHFHKAEMQCDFCDFNFQQNYFSYESESIVVKKQLYTQCSYALYTFTNNHSTLSFSLRAPPFLV